VPAVKQNAVGPTTTARTQTASTVQTRNTALPTTVPALPDPKDVPAVQRGVTVAMVNGQEFPVTTERRDNEIRLTVGPVRAVMGSYGVNGQVAALSGDGAVVIEPGRKIVVNLEGLTPTSEVKGVLYPNSVLLGRGTADANGRIRGEFSIPDVEAGGYRLVVSLVDDTNREMTLTYGVVSLGEGGGVGLTTVVFIALGLGTGAALFLAEALKRRLRAPV